MAISRGTMNVIKLSILAIKTNILFYSISEERQQTKRDTESDTQAKAIRLETRACNRLSGYIEPKQ